MILLRLMNAIALAASLIFLGQAGAMAASCDSYPEGIGQKVVDTPAGIKILSTAEASVPIDDRELYMDGITEATMEAKSSIASFMNEVVSKDCESNKKTDSDIKITAEGKSVDIKKVKTIVCSLRNSTDALLRGAVPLGSCYVPGEYVRVTVGIKPETISQAQRVSGQINRPVGGSTGSSYGQPRPAGGHSPVGGYVDDKRLYDF